jgi:hypothetical protein
MADCKMSILFSLITSFKKKRRRNWCHPRSPAHYYRQASTCNIERRKTMREEMEVGLPAVLAAIGGGGWSQFQ